MLVALASSGTEIMFGTSLRNVMKWKGKLKMNEVFFIFLRCLGDYRRRKWNENTFDIMPIIFYLYCKEMNIKCNSSQSIREKDVLQRLGGMNIEA